MTHVLSQQQIDRYHHDGFLIVEGVLDDVMRQRMKNSLAGLVEKGELPARLVGRQRRLPLKAVLAFKKDTQAKRLKTLGELVAHDQKLGLL